MSREGTLPRPPTVELSTNAPVLRITAGVGSANQKTWNVRRPVTLIGSRRPAHVVLHDSDVTPAHCVIVNTGTHVLLKDLHTDAGTRCNDVRVDLVPLHDGDVVTVGTTRIRVAISQPSDGTGPSVRDAGKIDPTLFAKPIAIGLVHSDRVLQLKESVVLVGRHERAQVRLDAEEVSDRHAVIFRSADGPAIFDVGGRDGVWVNGMKRELAPLRDGYRITIGPFGLQLGNLEHLAADMARSAGDFEIEQAASLGADSVAPSQEPAPADTSAKDGEDDASAKQKSIPGLEEMQAEIGDVWERLNEWQNPNATETQRPEASRDPASAHERELNLKDAALRGQLHDLACLRDQLAVRQDDLDKQAAVLGALQMDLASREQACDRREEELASKSDALLRRERAVTQRWSRLRVASCANCGSPFPTSESSASDPG